MPRRSESRSAMTKSTEQRFTRVFHAIVAILLLVCGGTLLGFGIYLHTNGRAFDLNYGSENTYSIALSSRTAAIVLGAFLLITGVVSLIALSKQAFGRTFRVLYFILALIILLVLVFVTAAAAVILRKHDDADVRDFVKRAWESTAKKDPGNICDIESDYQCRGFSDGDCILCKTGLESDCEATKHLCVRCEGAGMRDANVGCFQLIMDRLKSFFFPIAIVSAILALIVLTDMLFSCCM